MLPRFSYIYFFSVSVLFLIPLLIYSVAEGRIKFNLPGVAQVLALALESKGERGEKLKV